MPVQTNRANASSVPATPTRTVRSTAVPRGSIASTGDQPSACSSPHKATMPMNAGSTMTSRDSHEVRHCAAERHARSGRPRWKNDATRPSASRASARTLPTA
jgi:hypothetical protein